MKKLKIGIIFGGIGEEHDISVKSAEQVTAHLNTKKYRPFYIGITKKGEWKLCSKVSINWEQSDCQAVTLSPDQRTHGLLVQTSDSYESIKLDVVLPVLHGKSGEDGAIQGLLELAGIPYAGCDIQSSVLCMDKSLAYTVVKNAGIATPNFRSIMSDDRIDPEEFSYPVFVKPARSGSSFGVNKVEKKEDLLAAIREASQYDSKILVEEAVTASEVGCAVMGNGADLFIGEPDRIHLSHGFFKIHQEKTPETGSENSNITIPADISPSNRRRVLQTAKAIYTALGCKGLARVDMFLTKEGQVLLNEVNTLPGMTTYSRYPRMVAAAGVPFGEMIDRIILLALSEKTK